jgi:predicted Fe-Mo cluster-binding NifX family protein
MRLFWVYAHNPVFELLPDRSVTRALVLDRSLHRKDPNVNICIPVIEDQGQESRVSAHFGSAAAFMLVDTDSGTCRAIANENQHHGHGMCAPLATLRGESIDGMVVGGIGMGALNKLSSANIKVYMAEHATVADTLVAFKAGTLKPVDPSMACAQHGHGHA